MERSRWGRFDSLADANLGVLHDILEELAAKKDRTQVEQQVGDYYAACMDEPAIDRRGVNPIKTELAKIDALKGKQDLVEYVATMHRNGIPALFGFAASPSLHNSKMNIANFSQGGLTLDREDYVEPGADRDVDRVSDHHESAARASASFVDPHLGTHLRLPQPLRLVTGPADLRSPRAPTPGLRSRMTGAWLAGSSQAIRRMRPRQQN